MSKNLHNSCSHLMHVRLSGSTMREHIIESLPEYVTWKSLNKFEIALCIHGQDELDLFCKCDFLRLVIDNFKNSEITIRKSNAYGCEIETKFIEKDVVQTMKFNLTVKI